MERLIDAWICRSGASRSKYEDDAVLLRRRPAMMMVMPVASCEIAVRDHVSDRGSIANGKAGPIARREAGRSAMNDA